MENNIQCFIQKMINKNMSLMAESISESTYDYCSEKDIKYIEKEELMNNQS